MVFIFGNTNNIASNATTGRFSGNLNSNQLGSLKLSVREVEQLFFEQVKILINYVAYYNLT